MVLDLDRLSVTASVFSAFWYRVSGLRPRLGLHVRVERQIHRDAVSHLLVDSRTGRSLRLNAAAYAFAARLNGSRSVHEIWDLLGADAAEEAPTQDEVIGILTQLQERHLLQTEPGSDFEALFSQWSRQSAKRTRKARNPLAWRIALGSPERLLNALEPLAHALFRWQVVCVGVLGLLAAVVAAAIHWDALQAHAAKWMGTPYYALLALIAYPFVKAVHEIAHGLAVRRWGGEVPCVGVTLLVFMPVPFVDASAASTFRRAYQRAAVSAAGIVAELVLASIALVVWLTVQPGTVRDVAFVVAFIGAVSTVLFNANPLLRFDGYYLLTDLFDLPNLATRSARWWGEALRQYVLRVPVDDSLPVARGERAWLVVYAPLSWLYRLGICFAVTAWAGGYSVALGVVVALLLASTLLLAPAFSAVRYLTGMALEPRFQARALGMTGVAVVALVAALGVLPIPYGAVAQGVVWLPDQARLRVEMEGFVKSIEARDGQRVRPGDVLLVLANPALEAERAQLAAALAAVEPELYRAIKLDSGKVPEIVESLERARAELARAEERGAALVIRAGVEGTLVMPRQDDLPGTFARKGVMLGHVLPDGPTIVRVAVPEQDAALIGARTRAVKARLSENMAEVLAGEMIRDAGAASAALPSAALAVRHGGVVLTDPDDKEGLRPLIPIVAVDVRLTERRQERIGERAWVRFDYGAAPLAEQWMRLVRQALLHYFDPSS